MKVDQCGFKNVNAQCSNYLGFLVLEHALFYGASHDETVDTNILLLSKAMDAIHGLILRCAVPKWTHHKGNIRASQADNNPGGTDGTQRETRRVVLVELLDGLAAFGRLHAANEARKRVAFLLKFRRDNVKVACPLAKDDSLLLGIHLINKVEQGLSLWRATNDRNSVIMDLASIWSSLGIRLPSLQA